MANYRMNKLQIGSNTYECAEWYGVCTTAAATQAKTVSISGFTSAQLVEGCKVVVRFTQGQSATSPTLNVQSTGAKAIQLVSGSGISAYEWIAGQIVAFIYYNDKWVIEDGGHATTTGYGKTMLSNTIADNPSVALTPKAVYDAGYLTLADLPVWDGSVT